MSSFQRFTVYIVHHSHVVVIHLIFSFLFCKFICLPIGETGNIQRKPCILAVRDMYDPWLVVVIESVLRNKARERMSEGCTCAL